MKRTLRNYEIPKSIDMGVKSKQMFAIGLKSFHFIGLQIFQPDISNARTGELHRAKGIANYLILK